jgi:hypothetical protein
MRGNTLTNTDTTDVAVPAENVRFDRYQNQGWTDLVSGAAVVPGADLVPGGILKGVPFVITSATFRPGDYLSAVTGIKPHYVSLEIVTGDETAFRQAVKRGRVTEECGIDPGEELVFNEAGTGVYRQVVSAFESFGWITLPEGPMEGPYGSSRLDTSPDAWEFTDAAAAAGVEVRFDAEGRLVVSAPVWLHAKRGLRVSEYENDFTKEGVTRYLA